MTPHLTGTLPPGVLTRCCSGASAWPRAPGERVYDNR